MSERPDFSTLIETAPATLKRVSEPLITQLYTLPEIRAVDYLKDVDPNTQKLIEKLASYTPNQLISHITARQLLNLGLTVPKDVFDTEGNWYTQTPGEISNYLKVHRNGRNPKKRNDQQRFYSDPFDEKTAKWKESVAKRRNIWEFGVILQTQTEVGVLTVSVPWDTTNFSWHERLTPKEIFVGREKELAMFEQFLSDTTGERIQSKIERAINATDEQIWWGETQHANKIITGRYDSIRQRVGVPFAKRVVGLIEKEAGVKRIHDLAIQANRISGYFVSMFYDHKTGEMTPQLFIDTQNWIEEPTPVVSKKDKSTLSSYEILKQKEPDEKHMWIETKNGLRNSDWTLKPENGTFSVYILLPEGNGGKFGLEIIKHIKLKPGTERTYNYFVNHHRLGDGVHKNERASIEKKHVETLTKDDWWTVKKIFEEAKKRGYVDSETYWNFKKSEGLTSDTKHILEQASHVIERKMAEAGI